MKFVTQNIQGEMERCDLYWKKVRSVDENEEIIHGLGQI